MVRVRTIASTLTLAALCACSSGGGGGGSATQNLPPAFTSFSDVRANQTVVLSGRAATAVENNEVLTLDPHSDGSVTLAYDGEGFLKTMSISTARSSVTLDRGVCEGPLCAATNASRTAVALHVDPRVAQWDYQSFGIWVEQVNANVFVGGAISVGAPTAALPSVGEARFTGLASGFYGDSTGTYFTAASMSADVNFGSRTVGFATRGTEVLDVNTRARSARPELNLDGAFTVQGANSFSGSVRSVSGMQGEGSGKFYGPAAQEIGGVYSLQGSGASMMGGFGGKRP